MDIVPSREPENLARLLAVLDRAGRLDLLGTVGIAPKRGYDDLLSRSHPVEVGEGIVIRVLDLETYIELKEELGGEKDRAMLPILRQTLRERRNADGRL